MVGVILEGGGVRCAAQAGALSALASLGFEPDILVGCGAGAWVAALFALGLRGEALQRAIKDIREAGTWLLKLQPGFWRWRMPGQLPPEGLFDLERVLRILRWQTMQTHLQETELPLAVACWDAFGARTQVLASALPKLETEYNWSRTGTVAQAVGASLAVPGLIKPILWRGRHLQGGALPVPSLAPIARSMGATQLLRLRVLSHGDIGRDVFALALAPALATEPGQEKCVCLPVPTQAGLLDFAWMEQHYKIGEHYVQDMADDLAQVWHQAGGRLLPFSR